MRFHVGETFADVEVPEDIAAMIVEKDRLIKAAVKTDNPDEKCRLYGESFPIAATVRGFITKALKEKGYNVTCLLDYSMNESSTSASAP